jgi:cytochrome c oxidase cbb3-type subunit I/II
LPNEPSNEPLTSPGLTFTAATAQGRNLFTANCSGCHASNGDGNSPGGHALRPPALNLAAFETTDAIVAGALEHGVRGSSMPAWDELTSGQLDALASYAVSLQSGDRLPEKDMLASPDILREAGKRIYETHCTRCHGESGASDGPDARKRYPLPAKFADVRPSYAAAAKTIHEGVPGSAMDAWPLLSSGEIQAVTYYLRSFYKGPDRHAVTPPSVPASIMEEHP